MKLTKFLLLMLIICLCASCSFNFPSDENPTDVDIPSEPADVITEEEYNEPLDSVEGIEDLRDVSLLKEALSSVGYNFRCDTRVYFNKEAVSQVNDIYKTNFHCKVTSLFNENYIYRYSEDLVINEGYYNFNGNVYKTHLAGNGLVEKFNSEIVLDQSTLFASKSSCALAFTNLSHCTPEWIDLYKDPIDIKYSSTYTEHYEGWTIVGKDKYKCDRIEVVESFLGLCTPGFSNGGMYMTFDYVTIEINPDYNTSLKIRIYASSTQSGKLIKSHLDPEKPNWYFLFAEANISGIGSVSINAFENL